MKLFLFFIAVFFTIRSEAQILKRLGDRAKQKVEQKAGDKVDKSIDDATDGNGDSKTETEEGEVKEKTDGGEIKVKTEAKNPESLKTYSKYDFVPGDKIVYNEDFSQDAIGEFPLNWNTNGSGEVVTIDGLPGKWLQLQASTQYQTAIKNKLPDNYTIEFDVLFEFKDDQFVPNVHTILEADKLPGHAMGGKIDFTLAPNNGSSEVKDGLYFTSYTKEGDYHLQGTKKLVDSWNAVNHKKTPVHVAIWIQKQRFRAWLNQEKVYDLPQGVGVGVTPNSFAFQVDGFGGPAESFNYLVTNIKIAEATPDTRNKLITDGKWSTTGILFDVNSDKIKPTSYGVLKDIANVLKENPDVRVKIIGHTDSDGDDAKNLDLSTKRASSVRIALTTEFGIDGSRFETDGKGEMQPVADNKTPEGKAQNRRVEFVKL